MGAGEAIAAAKAASRHRPPPSDELDPAAARLIVWVMLSTSSARSLSCPASTRTSCGVSQFEAVKSSLAGLTVRSPPDGAATATVTDEAGARFSTTVYLPMFPSVIRSRVVETVSSSVPPGPPVPSSSAMVTFTPSTARPL